MYWNFFSQQNPLLSRENILPVYSPARSLSIYMGIFVCCEHVLRHAHACDHVLTQVCTHVHAHYRAVVNWIRSCASPGYNDSHVHATYFS